MSSENQQTEQVASGQGIGEKVIEQVKQAAEQVSTTTQHVAAKVAEAAQPHLEAAQAAAKDVADKAAEVVKEVQQNGVSAAVPKITGEASKEQQDAEMGTDSPPKDKESPSKVPAEEASSAGQKRERPLSPLPPQTNPFPPPPTDAPAPVGEAAPAPADVPASTYGQDAKKPKLDEEATKTTEEETVEATDAEVFEVSEEQLAKGGDADAEVAKPGSRGKDSVTSADDGDKISTRTRSKASV